MNHGKVQKSNFNQVFSKNKKTWSKDFKGVQYVCSKEFRQKKKLKDRILRYVSC